MNIRNSLYWAVFTMIVLPFLLFTLLITNIYSGRLEKVISESLHVVADAQIAEMTNFCEQQRDYLIMIGAMDVSRAAMRGALDEEMILYLNNILYSYVQATDSINSIALIAKNRRVEACSEHHAFFADQGLERLIEMMGDQDFFISDVMLDNHGEKTLVAISRIASDSELLGYALLEINLDFYKNIRERAELWNESTFYLLDGKQQIISAGTPQENRDTFITTPRERADYNRKLETIDFSKNPRGSFQYKIEGKNYITYYSDVEYTNWRIMLSVNVDNYQAERTVYFALASFLVMLCAVLAIWIGWFASKRIVRPIKCISGTLKGIQEKQDYTLRMAVARKDELGNLAAEINELIDFIETENLYKAQQQRLLQQKAEQDALTKVLNKERISQYLQDALTQHRAQRTLLAVLFVDVDDFKAFNTNYGHGVGDQVLLFLASLLAGETGGTVGRVGGDEFLVVVEAPEKVRLLDGCLMRVQEMAGTRFTVRGTGVRLPISCCIGAVRVDFAAPSAQDLTVQQLIDLADCEMYRVKNSGKQGYAISDYE